MEKKRSIGITIFGVLILVEGALSLSLSLNYKPLLEAYIRPSAIIIIIAMTILTIVQIIVALNVLKLKEWARKNLLLLTLIFIVTIFVLPLVENRNYSVLMEQRFLQHRKEHNQHLTPEQKKRAEQWKLREEERIKKYPPEKQEKMRQEYISFEERLPARAIKMARLSFKGLFLLWYLSIIFFFTRPKVKEQFKETLLT